MSSGLIGILLVLVVAAGALLARSGADALLRRRARERWRQLAAQAGLSTASDDSPYPRASGSLAGMPVEAWVDELRTFGLTQQFLRLRIAVGEVPELFIRTRRPEMERSTWSEVAIGDPLFDLHIRVNATSAQDARRWLIPPRREALLALHHSGETWSVGDGALGLSRRGLPAPGDGWQSQLDQLQRSAQQLERA